MKNKSTVYWDTSVWITILGDQKTSPIYAGSIHAKERMEKSENSLVVSQLIRLEIYKTVRNDKSKEIFSGIMKRKNVMPCSVTNKIIETAYDIQMEVVRLGNNKKLKNIDALHLATAIYYNVNEFYSADPDHTSLNGILKTYTMPKIIVPPIPLQEKLHLV